MPEKHDIRPGQSLELLKELHILTRDGKLNQDSRRKLKQVYHLYQFIEPLLQEVRQDHHDIILVDHGAGKSYLGFILYDLYFKDQDNGSHIFGIETRDELVEKSRALAQRLKFPGMTFLNLSVAESITSEALPERVDLVTALHACDTATDDAIRFALKKQARFIVLAPCCQAEVASLLRKNKGMALPQNALTEIWRRPLHTREFGSLLTNVLRCLQLEAHGYQVNVTELVGWEHSMKNELIIASYKDLPRRRPAERLHEVLRSLGLEEISPRFFTSVTVGALFSTQPAIASGGGGEIAGLTHSGMGIFALLLFIAAYLLVIFEEQLHLRKSKPVIVAAGIIWVLVALSYQALGKPDHAHAAILHNLTEYAELFLFLLAAMTYINAMEERNVFNALRSWLVNRGYTLRTLFWITGALAFVISPVADNLTTALLMGAVAMAVGGANRAFVVVACINIVVAANAGGAFSPFGDITTLMVWQKGKVSFFEFFAIFIPSVINWLIPAVIMSFTVPREKPEAGGKAVRMKLGAKRIMALFLLTIVTAVSFHNFLKLPPAVGMMLGLGYLSFFAYYLNTVENRLASGGSPLDETGHKHTSFDFFHKVASAEWDTLLFFYGVILCVGGLGQFGYLAGVSKFMYNGLGDTTANVLVGILSSVIDNIPVMFAVLTMDPQMSHGQWLLVTMTVGVGGSLLSIGSAAGVALMGSARGIYTFGAHLKWSWAIALGYAASIVAHLLLNGRYF